MNLLIAPRHFFIRHIYIETLGVEMDHVPKNPSGYYLTMVSGNIKFIVQLSQRRHERLMGME